MRCLNPNRNTFDFAANIGANSTFDFFKNSRYSNLPEFKVFANNNTIVYSQAALENIIEKFLPKNVFAVQHLNRIVQQLPVESKAAFFKDVLYFGENVSKEDVAEETFHAIFQRLIPSNIRDRYLEEGKGLVENVDQKVLELKASQPIIYGNLTKEQAKERVIEEAIAAAYVNYFVKNTTPTDKKNGILTLLSNLFKWLRNLFYSAKQNESDLELFFGDILKGNFTKSTVQNTNESDVPTLRLVEYTGVDDNGFAVRKTLNNKESDGMIASIASIVIELDDKLSLEQKDNLDLKTRSKRIFFAINKLKDFYLKNGDNFKASALEQYSETKRNPETLKKETIVSPSLQHLKEDVNKYLNVVTGRVQQEEKEVDEDDEAELLGSDTIAANEKGFDGLSAWIRNYISTTGKEIGSFEIDGVENMIKIFEVIDKGKIYYSLARAMQNSTTEIERLYKLVEIASLGTNSDTRILVTRVIRDVRSTNPTDSDRKVFDDFQKDVRDLYRTWKSDKVTHRSIINQIPNLNKDKQFILQTLLQGFNLWNRENYQVNVDIEKLEGKDVITTKAYPANQNSATEVQIQMWENYFDDVRDRISIRRFNELKTNIESKKDLENSLTEVFSMLFGGMDASYINYLINPSNDNSIGGTYSNTGTLTDVAEILKVVGEDLKAKESILFKNEDGAVARLKKLAVNTAKVNERVIESTYKDAENKTRYSYQNKTFQLFMFNEFFNSNHIEEYKNKITSNTLYEYSDGKFLTQASRFLYDSTNVETKKGLNHVLFSSEKWKEALSNGLYYSIDGLTTKIGAATFGGMENRDFFLYKLHLQFQRTNNGMQPIHINLMESKRTASFKELMIVEGLYDNNGLTEKASKAFSLEILKELKRMHDEKPKVISWLQQIVSKSVPEDGVVELTRKSVIEASSVSAAEGIIEKYHTGKYKVMLDENNHVVDFIVDEKQARAFNFTDNLKGFLSAKQFEELKEKFFNTTQTFDQVFENLSTNANFLASVKKGLNEYIQEYESEIQKSKGTLPVNTRFGNLNDTKNRTKEQESQFRNDALSQWLNTMWVNQLLNSDSALTVKNDGADFVKRAGGQNAAIQSLVTTFVPPASYNITEADDLSKTRYVVGTDPKGIVSFKPKTARGKTNDVESADAQSYNSVHAYRKYLYGIGKLSNDISQLLNKVELGVPLSNEDIQLMRERGTYLNVLKPVGYDGFFYFKTGTLMLSRELTSHWNNQNVSREILFKEGRFTELNDENNWVAKRGRESLHNLRIAMEKNNVDYYLSQTASKQLTINKLTKEFDKFPDTLQSDEEFQSSINVMDTNFFGQQMENPAGKKSIIDPSQMLEIILNEQRENVFVRIDGVEWNIKDALQKWVQLSKNRDNLKFTEALNEIANPDFTINYNRFIDKAKESLIASGGDDQLIEFFSKDANGNPEYNLNMSVTIDKFVSLLMSHFTKGVLQQKVAGDSLALISPHGLNGIKKLIKYKAKVDNGYKDVYSWEWVDENSQEYQDAYSSAVPITDVEYSEVDENNQVTGSLSPLNQTIKDLYEAGNLYVVDELRFGVPVWKTTGETVDGIPVVHSTPEYYGSEALHPSYEKGVTNTKELRGAFAVRIPSQDKHSATNILWVGKLAEFYGNTIAVPKEIQYLSGSDYDIDKLYLHRKEIYYSKENSDWKVWSMKDHTFDKYVMYHSKYNKTVLRYSKEALVKDPYYTKFLEGIDAVKLEMKEVRERFNKEYEEDKTERTSIDVGKLKQELAAIDKEIERLEMTPEDLTEASVSESIKNLQLQTDFIKADIEWKKELSEKLQEGYYVLPVQGLKNKLTALNEGLNRVIEFNLYPIFRDLKLITTDTEFNQRAEQGEVMIHPIINNQLLDLKQRFLTNEETLDRSKGEAIALTPATQDNLKELLSQSFVMVNGKQEFLFKDVIGQNADGTVKYKERFSTDSKWSTHSQLGQHQAHRNVVTGKRNIGVAVVGNLLHLFTKKAKLKLEVPISFSDVDKNGELFQNTLFTFNEAINKRGNRIADIISELISAATDEAKDQQNAKYNLSIEALNIVIPMLMLGSSLESAILLVNHPKVQEYLQLVSKKGLILKTDAERKALESNNEAILKEMLSSQTLTSTLSILDFKNGRNPDGALALAGKMLQISKEIGSANYIISLKKGLGKDLNSFESGEEKIDATTKEKIPKEALTNIATVFTGENPMLEQYQNQISIHNKISRLFDKNIIRRIPSYRELSSIYKANFKNSGYAPFVKWMNDNVLGFVYSKLYFDSLGENKDLYEKQTNEALTNTETKWGNFLAELKNKDSKISKEIRESLLENPFVKKIRKSKKSTELRIPTFVKSDITSSSSLTDGFLDMHIKLFNTPYESLTRELFHYFVHKDAWIFKAGSLSKGIHPLFFKEHSRSLDGAIKNPDSLSDVPTGLLAYLAIEKSMSTFGAKDNVKRISKKISPLTAKIVTDNGFTSEKFGELTKEQKEGLIENGYMMLKDGRYPVLTPPLYHKFQEEVGMNEYKEFLFKLKEVIVQSGGNIYTLNAKDYFANRDRIYNVVEAKYAKIGFEPFNTLSLPLTQKDLDFTSYTVFSNTDMSGEKENDFVQGEKLINNEDVELFNKFPKLPVDFFTSKTLFKEFYNNETGKRGKAPSNTKWILNTYSLYDLTDMESGEQLISNVDLKTGYQMIEVPKIEESVSTYTWSRYSENSYEVSSKGDKRFSALIAKLRDGRTIEEAYQLDIKGYRVQGNDWKLGKGKAPIRKVSKEQSWEEYKQLWKTYLQENPDLLLDLREKAKGKVLTDQFATTDVSQARALAEILNEESVLNSGEVPVISQNIPTNFEQETGEDNKQFQKLTEEEKNQTISEAAKKAGSVNALHDLAARLADRIGGEVVFENRRDVDYKGYSQGNTSVINEAYADTSTVVHEILGHPIINAIRNVNDETEQFFSGKVENVQTLYKNLLKELESGKGKEVLERVKKDYLIKGFDSSDFQDWLKIRNNGRFNNSRKDYSSDDLYKKVYEKEIEEYKRETGKDLYANYTLEEQQEEAIVELLGMYTANKLDAIKDKGLIALLKQLLKEMTTYLRSLFNSKEIDIEKLDASMTLDDLANLLAYTNSKLILPNSTIKYTTPDNQSFKTYVEASKHISELAKSAENIDLEFINLNTVKTIEEVPVSFNSSIILNSKERLLLDEDGSPDIITDYLFQPLIVKKIENNWYVSEEYDFDYAMYLYDTDPNVKETLKHGLLIPEEKVIELFNTRFKNSEFGRFIAKNTEFEKSKEIIEEWKKVNNIVYNPEEVYSRGQGFYSVVGAYSNFEVELMFQNLLQHIEDNEKAGGEFTISAFTKPIDKTISHLEGGGGKIKFVIYPKSEDIKWATNQDAYSGSVWDAAEKVNKDKKSELLGVSYTKYPSLKNLYSVQPNLANIIQGLSDHHNELGISLNSNFRIEYDENIPYSTKKILNSINSILDGKYGKLEKPEFRNKTVPPTTTNSTLKESIDSINLKIAGNPNAVYYPPKLIDKEAQEITGGIIGGYWVEALVNDNPDIFTFNTLEEANNFITKNKGLDKEYTFQALINTKIAALKEVAKKYPRSLIRSEVVSISDNSNIQYQKQSPSLTTEQTTQIEELKQSDPRWNKYSNEDIQRFIDSVFPESQVKEIVYHGTDLEPNSVDFKTNRGGIFLASTPIYASYFSEQDNAYPALINFKNGYQAKGLTDNVGKDAISQIKARGYDSVIGKGGITKMQQHKNDLEFIAFELPQVYILNSDKAFSDMEKFVGNDNIAFSRKPSNFVRNVNELGEQFETSKLTPTIVSESFEEEKGESNTECFL